MSESPFNTFQLHNYVLGWQEGDRTAADQLLRTVGSQLENLSRRMLRGFPSVRSCVETSDVLQGSILRLLNTLTKLCPSSTRHFFNLAAVHIRRELIDLARSFAQRHESPLQAELRGTRDGTDAMTCIAEPEVLSVADLELWSRFHEKVEELPDEQREVMSLRFYHGLTHEQIAELFEIDESTVRYRWQLACVKLNRLLAGQLPPL